MIFDRHNRLARVDEKVRVAALAALLGVTSVMAACAPQRSVQTAEPKCTDTRLSYSGYKILPTFDRAITNTDNFVTYLVEQPSGQSAETVPQQTSRDGTNLHQWGIGYAFSPGYHPTGPIQLKVFDFQHRVKSAELSGTPSANAKEIDCPVTTLTYPE